MQNFCRAVILSSALLVITTCFNSFADEGLPVQTVASRAFEITVSPVDRESCDARSADLFITTKLGSDWRIEGPCEIIRTAAGPRFKKRISVKGDGIYYFTSRASDAAGKAPAPPVGSPAQVKVIVDTTRPMVQLVSPVSSERLYVGKATTINWSAEDDNFGEKPIRLSYSTDFGESWSTITEGTENDGAEKWIVPNEGADSVLVRVSAFDAAGNETSATTSRPLALVADPEAGTVPTEGVLLAMAESKPEKSPIPANEELPASKHPEMDANAATKAYHSKRVMTSVRAAWIAYIMAGNLVRQGRIKDALRYYRTAVDADEEFDEAWNDAGLIYKELGAYEKAMQCVVKAIKCDIKNPAYYHNRGEVYQAKGLALLEKGKTVQDEAKANESIHLAVKSYGKSIELAQGMGRLAERAASFFRLGEICYYANHDPVGARSYWRKVMTLHTPTPDLDNVMYDEGTPREEKTLDVYHKYTSLRVSLETWQRWSREYIRQLNEMENNGLLQGAPGAGDLNENNSRQAYYPDRAARRTPTEPVNNVQGEYASQGYGRLPLNEDQSLAQYTTPAPEPKSRETIPDYNASESSSRKTGINWPWSRKKNSDQQPKTSSFWEYKRY